LYRYVQNASFFFQYIIHDWKKEEPLVNDVDGNGNSFIASQQQARQEGTANKRQPTIDRSIDRSMTSTQHVTNHTHLLDST
jgi:hypothetical protein